MQKSMTRRGLRIAARPVWETRLGAIDWRHRQLVIADAAEASSNPAAASSTSRRASSLPCVDFGSR
jgi:hypothetical protein